MAVDPSVHVLALTTNEKAPFFTQQVEALRQRGVRTTVLAVPGDPTAPDGRGPSDYVRFGASVRRHVDSSVDLVHAHYGLTAPMALAQRQCPVVLSLWGSDLHHRWIAPISRLAARACAEVIVMSGEMDEMLDVNAHVIPDGVDLERFRPMNHQRARRSVGWSSEGYDVFFPYSKDRPVKDYPRARRIVGRVDRRMDAPVRLRTVSDVPHERMPRYMNAADALLLTSKSEGSPNAVKEALACNLPVVATAVGDVPERLDGVGPSRFGENDRALVDGLVDVLRSGERSNGRETVRSISIERATDRHLAVYEGVVDAAIDVERDTVTRRSREQAR